MHNNSMAMTTPWAYNIALYCILNKSVFKKYHLDEGRIKRWEIYHCEMVTEPIFTCFLHVSKYVAMGVGSGCPSCFTGLGIPSCVKKQPQPHVQGHKGTVCGYSTSPLPASTPLIFPNIHWVLGLLGHCGPFYSCTINHSKLNFTYLI